MQNIVVDIAQNGVSSTLFFKQGDVNRTFQVTVTDNGMPYDVQSAELVSVWYSGSSGEGIYTDAGEESACAVEGNVITVKVIEPMIAKKGAGTLCLMLSHPDGTQLGLWNIIYHVEGVPGYESPEAMSYYNALGRMIRQVKEVAEELKNTTPTIETDTSLTVWGMPADAGEVGDRLQTMENKMWPDTSLSQYNVPADAFTVGQKLMSKLDYKNDAYSPGCYKVGDYYHWLNAPMHLATEYKMIWRHTGEIVYAKLCNYGVLPNASAKNVDTGIPAGAKVISCELIVSNSEQTMQFINPWKIDGKEIVTMAYTGANGIQLSVTTSGDLSLYSATCMIKYIKE